MASEPAGKDAVAEALLFVAALVASNPDGRKNLDRIDTQLRKLTYENERLRLSLERLRGRHYLSGVQHAIAINRILAGETPPEPGQPWADPLDELTRTAQESGLYDSPNPYDSPNLYDNPLVKERK